jgi:hypothetical protein
MARAMPVLPELDSSTVTPGPSRPSFSASSTIALAARSLTDPPGFWPSSLARMRTRGFGAQRGDVDERRVADEVEDGVVGGHAGA